MGGGVTLLGVDEVRELGRVAQEEDGGVVSNIVPVALRGAELDGKATGVTVVVVGPRLATDSGEADGDGALGALLEDVGDTEVAEVVGTFPFTVGSSTLGVDDTLGDTLPVKVGKEV